MKVELSPYFETLSSAIHGAIYAADNQQAILAAPATIWDELGNAMQYGETRSRSFELTSLRERNTRKFFNVTIYRLDSGRYELTTYVL